MLFYSLLPGLAWDGLVTFVDGFYVGSHDSITRVCALYLLSIVYLESDLMMCRVVYRD